MGTKRFYILVSLGVSLILIVAMLALSKPAIASTPSGSPVSCTALVNQITPATFICKSVDGTIFVDGTTLPAGYYLMVTDVLINCPASNLVGILMKNADSNGSYDSSLELYRVDGGTRHFEFHVPYIVLPPGHRLDVSQIEFYACNNNDPKIFTRVYVTGVLTPNPLATNLLYVPFVSR